MSVTSPGTAKNCITLGACENLRPEFNSASLKHDADRERVTALIGQGTGAPPPLRPRIGLLAREPEHPVFSHRAPCNSVFPQQPQNAQ
jgi:hypothetical protein